MVSFLAQISQLQVTWSHRCNVVQELLIGSTFPTSYNIDYEPLYIYIVRFFHVVKVEGIIVETTLISTLNAGRVMLFKIVVVICKHSISIGINTFICPPLLLIVFVFSFRFSFVFFLSLAGFVNTSSLLFQFCKRNKQKPSSLIQCVCFTRIMRSKAR